MTRFPVEQVRSLPARLPGTIIVTAVVTLIGILMATVLHSQHQAVLDAIGLDIDSLKAGRLWTMPAATLFQGDPQGLKWHEPLVLALFLGLLEYQAGSLRALVTFFISDWISSPLAVLATWALGAAGSATARSLYDTPDMGSSAAYFGAGAAGALLLPRPAREAVLGGLALYLAAAFLFERLDVAVAHVLAATTGVVLTLLAGWLSRTHHVRLLGGARACPEAAQAGPGAGSGQSGG